MCKGEPDSFRYANEVSSKAFLLCFKKGWYHGHDSSLSL
ncbi:hypothetical protein CHCC14820_0355 [Bacillus paralicheniformis]|uniref:Uncharacterized protein n=1 Tax=Bacillus paralicheniformis TaxID=1648923 RepID=A0A6I7TJ70_9BACI|nr:hypothetical protein SC10_B2orf04661 [Bacillus paralicheniformis]OLF96596.1 hypothetical protein B4121_0807 [Bacillus paralicheniformis]OLG08659.1 hypothetical protein B4125_0235 [Bacillus paralicheniformis]OLG10558.1 hypothetical protein B4123_2999 [Bacillus paralicheniformis]OLG11869.1 hypothetical protein B4123_1674 [Bacillus paralicheniformis]